MIMYSVDAADRFWRNEKAKQKQKKLTELRKKKVAAMQKAFRDGRLSQTQRLQCLAATEHLREHLKRGEIYKLPQSSPSFRLLANALEAPVKAKNGGAKRRRIETDTSSFAVAANDDKPLFFKVVATNPKRGKHVKAAPALSSWITGRDFAVAFHEALDCNGRLEAAVKPIMCGQSCSSVALFRVCPMHVGELAETLERHALTKTLHMSFPDFADPDAISGEDCCCKGLAWNRQCVCGPR